MNSTKTTLIQNSLNLLGDNPSHTFFAVTIRPYEDFLRRFPYSTRTQITEEIIQNLILKYEAHLISEPNKPKNDHLRIISHNAIETKTKFGSLSTAEQNQSKGRRKISPLDVMQNTVLQVVPVVHRRDPRCFV